jgi:integrase
LAVYGTRSFGTINIVAARNDKLHFPAGVSNLNSACSASIPADRQASFGFGGTMLHMDDDIDLAPPTPVFRAQKLDTLVDLWLAACRKRLGEERQESDEPPQLHSATVDGYEDDLAHFRRWWAAVGPTQDWELREEDLHDFNRWLTKATKLSYNSRNDALRRLKSMLHWAFEYKYIKTMDFSLWVPDPEGSAPVRVLPALSALAEVMRAAKRCSNPVRNKAILAILVDTGMRRNECANLKIEDIHLRPDGSGTIIVRRPKVDRRRESRQRPVIFAATAGSYIRQWITELATAGRTQGPLFPSPVHPGRPIDPNALYRAMKRIIAAAGYEKVIQGPHDLRRMYITQNRRQRDGAFDRDLREQVGHSSAVMTDYYDHDRLDDRRDKVGSMFDMLAAEGYSWE